MTVRDLFPDFEPSLNLDFGNVKALDPRVTFTRASSATYIDAGGLWQEASDNQPRFDHVPVTLESLGLLIEEQRTNTFTNPRMLNGVPGTPGTQPSDMGNWNLSTSGLTIEYVQNVTYNNLTGVRYRLSGTAAATLSVSNLFAPSSAGWTASSGQNWTGSVFIAVQSGLGTVNNFTIQLSARAGGGTAGNSTSASLISSLTAIPTRFSHTYASVPGTTTGIVHQVVIRVTSGVAVDITFDLYWPQLEQGLFATSPILPPGTTIAASTRAVDAVTMSGTNFTSWFNYQNGSIMVEAAPLAIDFTNEALTRPILRFLDFSSTLRGIGFQSSFRDSTRNVDFVTRNSTDISSVSSGNAFLSAGQMFKAVGAYSNTDIAGSFSNSAVSSSVAYLPAPEEITSLQIATGNPISGVGGKFNGHIRQIKYYNAVISNTEIRTLTR
jgi:hypothetical protein